MVIQLVSTYFQVNQGSMDEVSMLVKEELGIVSSCTDYIDFSYLMQLSIDIIKPTWDSKIKIDSAITFCI